ncbi:FAD-dependent monooxygenase [Streptomyces sp. NPDC004393]|uniref:FAD-dependent monooxygenase n=1 Tax=Streptomyces sp. NPDC004533 TaxID=3154278 RepID=UPI0033B5AB9F
MQDAAHVTPPTGGFGANAGIQDAWNLTAKLVSVLRDDADPGLLDDYESERHAVGRLTVEQALLRLGDRAETPVDSRPLLSEAAVAIGYRYRMPGDDPDRSVPEADEPGRRRGEPGTRLPHMFLTGRYDGLSTLDLVRDGRHLLLSGPEGHGWVRAAHEVDPRGTFLGVAQLPRQARSGTARPTDVCGIDDRGAMLVRPDHVIAWRTTHATANPTTALTEAVRQAVRPIRVTA